ncbi:RNA methyltransferase [Seminavis robusta]|uniref:16S rRNA (uracil(1498)-N(3))-methyltransferase n=1 Tax=Seminavis robusta TaxID=568900 RepID=A0A9N8E6Z7_9STRA|nr:RNA methyltransferase [Seminavis robusta]|eukprot:Sro616_g176050.1 RNA methyltransferase (316) ;mRNA; f:50649-51596
MNLILLQPSELTVAATTSTSATSSSSTSSDEAPSERTAVLAAGDARAKHIVKHLRKTTGETVTVGIEGAHLYQATIVVLDNGSLELSLSQQTHDDHTAQPRVTLLLAMPFPMRLKYLWPVVASMMVERVVVIQGSLSNPEFAKSRVLQPDTYLPLLREGLSQGGHTQLPTVEVAVDQPMSTIESLEGLLNKTDQQGDNSNTTTVKIFLDCGDETTVPPTVREIIMGQTKILSTETPSAVIAIGPERGWTEQEAQLFAKAGFHAAALGPSILRVDTAVISAISLTQAALQEWCLKHYHSQHAEGEGSNNKRKHGED